MPFSLSSLRQPLLKSATLRTNAPFTIRRTSVRRTDTTRSALEKTLSATTLTRLPTPSSLGLSAISFLHSSPPTNAVIWSTSISVKACPFRPPTLTLSMFGVASTASCSSRRTSSVKRLHRHLHSMTAPSIRLSCMVLGTCLLRLLPLSHADPPSTLIKTVT